MEPRVYPPAERPDVEVLVDGTWHEGELRMWARRDGEWVGQVQWKPAGTNTRRIDTFPADQIRMSEPPPNLERC